jgi:hypothetical protein
MNRRTMLMGAAALVTSLPRVAMGGAGLEDFDGKIAECWKLPGPDKPQKPEVAFSFRRFLNSKGFMPLRTNMTRLEGYVIDKDRNDIILWGRREPNMAEVVFDDIVVAIRSVCGVYGGHPSVTIDIDRERYGVFSKKSPGIHNEAGMRAAFDAAHIEHHVTVWGLPTNVRAANVLVMADYKMKLVQMGNASLKIRDPFPSRFDRYRQEILSGKNHGAKEYRFWFQPASMSYLRSNNTMFLDKVQVVLRNMVSSSFQDQSAGSFACDWTNRMDEINRSETLWQDMYGVFRNFALARALYQEELLTRFDRYLLLAGYRTDLVSTPTKFPGLIRTFPTKNGGVFYSHGGVELDGSMTRGAASDEVLADVHRAGEMALASMPRSCDEACWVV